jgi:glycosyltransferase involved in cell wall biosynthesis
MPLNITGLQNDRNEVDQNAMGGTELMGAGLARHVSPDVLSKVNVIRSRVRYVAADKPNVLWLHDLPEDPESHHLADPKRLAEFDRLVYVSNWQKERYQLAYGIPASKGVVIKNAIEPIPEELIKKGEDGKIRLIYHPTPHRGLNLLVPVFGALSEEFPELELDVFSSFALYGWKERDEQFRSVIDACIAHPKINYHGSQPQEVVRAALGRADIFAYPSIWMETSCICAMEAMSARCVVVAPNYAALPETTAGFAHEYQWTEDLESHVNRFYITLREAILNVKHGAIGKNAEAMEVQKLYADTMYGWKERAQEWNALLGYLVQTSSR